VACGRSTDEGPIFRFALVSVLCDRQAVLGYLKADSISALPFRRLAGADTARASQLFQHLLKKPSFSWERDGEALLRKHKPWCFGAKPKPPVTPLSSELAEVIPSSR
jgi:hypothetical protein